MLLELLHPPFTTVMERVRVMEDLTAARSISQEVIPTKFVKTRELLFALSQPDPSLRLSAQEVCTPKRLKDVRTE